MSYPDSKLTYTEKLYQLQNAVSKLRLNDILDKFSAYDITVMYRSLQTMGVLLPIEPYEDEAQPDVKREFIRAVYLDKINKTYGGAIAEGDENDSNCNTEHCNTEHIEITLLHNLANLIKIPFNTLHRILGTLNEKLCFIDKHITKNKITNGIYLHVLSQAITLILQIKFGKQLCSISNEHIAPILPGQYQGMTDYLCVDTYEDVSTRLRDNAIFIHIFQTINAAVSNETIEELQSKSLKKIEKALKKHITKKTNSTMKSLRSLRLIFVIVFLFWIVLYSDMVTVFVSEELEKKVKKVKKVKEK